MAVKSAITLQKRSAVQDKVPLTTDLELGQVGMNTYDGKMFMKIDDGVEAVVPVGHDRVRWRNKWAEITYDKNDMVVDGEWTMIANKETSDRAGPQPSGDPTYSVAPDPTWSTQSDASVVISSHTYTFLEGGWLTEVRAYVPQLTDDTTYIFRLVDRTDPAFPKVSTMSDPLLIEDGWATIAANRLVVPAGSVLELLVDALNSGSDTLFSGGWNYTGTSNNGTPTTDGEVLRNTGHSELRFNYTDLDTTDRTSELQGVTSGYTITLVDTNNAANFLEYTVIAAPTDNGTWVEYNVQLSQSGGTLPQGTTTCNFIVPIARATQYVQAPGQFTTNPPSFATVVSSLKFNGVDQSAPTDTAYGIDLKFQPSYVSEDWDFVASSANGGGSSGGGGDGIGDVPDDGILYGRKFEVWEPAATQSQGLLADTALQPGDNISELVNDVPYLTLGTLPDDLVTSVHGRVGDVIGESGDYDASLITYSNTNSGLTATQVQGALDEIELDKIDRMMFWEDEWVAGTYGKNAVVRDGLWTMIANTQTSQVPHPVEVGTPENTFPETPAFATQSAEGVIVSGSDFVFTHDVYVTSIRVWVPAVNNDTVYNFVYENVTSGEITTTSGLSLVSNSWNVVSTKPHQALVGDNHRVYIESENTNPGTTITGSWAFQPDNNEPDDGHWSHETEADLYIDRRDSSGTDRSSELENLVTGAIIRFENPGDPSTYKEYTATSDAARIGTSYVMTATLTGSTIGDFIEDELTDMTAIIPAVTPTEYSEISGYWTTNSPTTWANISGILEIDGVPASAPNDGFGVDIEVQLVEIPTDWDLVAYSADGDTGSGSGGSVFADGDFAIKGSVDDTKEMVFDVSNISPGNIRTLFTPDLDGEILVSEGDQDVLGLKHFQTGLGVGSSDSNFFVDTVNSYVGINTATPGKALDIRGGAGADVEFRVTSTDQQANMILDGLSPSSTGLVGELSFRNSGDSICILSCRTDGAPDGGRFDFRTQSGGSMTSQMLLDSTGQLYLLNLDGTGSGSSMRFDTGSGQLRYDTSSIRHKENVRPDTFTSWIHDLDVVTYDRKDGSRMNEVGIIAEQMASCCTDTITYNKAGEIEGYNKEDMVPYLLKEIQILKIELDALKAKLEE